MSSSLYCLCHICINGLGQFGFEILPREVVLLRKLNHKNIIKMLDYFEDMNKVYLVMEKPEIFDELFYYVIKHKGLSEDLSRLFFHQIVEAVEYCHSMGVVHRDIKLSNILIDLSNNQTKLVDFGCATFLCKKFYTEYQGERNRNIIYFISTI